MENTKIIVTSVGKDKVGIIAKITGALADANIDILDISQTIMQNFHTMVLIADIKEANVSYSDLIKTIEEVENSLGIKITVQREDVFNYMHRI